MIKHMSNNYSRAKTLILIPVIVFAVTVICMVLAMALGSATDKGTIYSIFAFIGILGLFLSPLPCLVMSVVGVVFALKATREGIVKARGFLAIGIVEILFHVIGVVLAVAMFIGGQGV